MRTQAPSDEVEEVAPGTAASQPCHMLLTGGTGFLGSALIAALMENHPTATVTLLIRAKRGEEADTRLQKHIRKLFPDAQEVRAHPSSSFPLAPRHR
jgi:FlaA1/EpsC-like NDP-sugar epimerase